MKAAAFLAVIVIVLGLPVSNGSDDPLFGEKALIEIKTVIIQLFKCSVKLVFKFIRLEEVFTPIRNYRKLFLASLDLCF